MADKVPTSRLVRGSKLGQVAAGRAIRSAGTRVSMVGRSEEVRARLAEKSAIAAADQLVTVLGSMKGVAMKLGQMLSILDLDLVPEEHREEFQRKLAALRDQAPTTSFETMRDVIEADYGRPLGDVFAEFDPEAVAAASIGQVYRARLHDGRDVAVKVQYPGIDAAIRADMKNLTMFLKIWKSTVPTLSTPALLNELRLNFEGELDYEREALTQRKIAQLYANHPFIAVPDSVPELSTHRVLVSEFFGGTGFAGIRELPSGSETGSARSSFASTSVRCTAITSSAETRIPETCCSGTTAVWGSWTSDCSTAWTPSTSSSRRAACARRPRAARTTCTR